MRRKNRKIKKNSSFATGSMGVASLIVCGFIVMMVYWLFDSKCSAIQRDIAKAEKELKSLETECTREMSAWNAMKTPEKLSAHLTRFGLEMKLTRQDQIVRMDREGRPLPGQIAVVRARSRVQAMDNLAYKSSAAVSSSSSAGHTARQLPKSRITRR